MKGSLVFIVLVVAVISATRQHIHKDNPQGKKIEMMDAGLKEIKTCLPPGASVTFRMPEGAGMDLYMQWRYLLAPRYCSINDKEHFDTVLAVCNRNISDSVLHTIINNRKVICSIDDGQYKYYLTCNNK